MDLHDLQAEVQALSDEAKKQDNQPPNEGRYYTMPCPELWDSATGIPLFPVPAGGSYTTAYHVYWYWIVGGILYASACRIGLGGKPGTMRDRILQSRQDLLDYVKNIQEKARLAQGLGPIQAVLDGQTLPTPAE